MRGHPACARSYHPAADLATVLARLTAHPAHITLLGPGGQHQTLTVTAAMPRALAREPAPFPTP
jgi:hypothetical protein